MWVISKKKEGFTLVESLIFIAIFVVILSISFSFLLITFRSGSKSEALNKVKQNGDFALSIMERFVISAREVAIADDGTLWVTDLNGLSTNFSCAENRIASNTAFLTDEDVSVGNCNFDLTAEAGQPAVVGVGFSVSFGQGGLSSEKANLSFDSSFVVRNQQD